MLQSYPPLSVFTQLTLNSMNVLGFFLQMQVVQQENMITGANTLKMLE